MTASGCAHKIYARYIGTESGPDGEEMIRVGCRDCSATIMFPAKATEAVKHNRALEIIRSAGPEGIQSAALEERLGVSHGHVVRILRCLQDNGAIIRLTRGWYAAPRLTAPAQAALASMPKDYDGEPGNTLEDLGALYSAARAMKKAVP